MLTHNLPSASCWFLAGTLVLIGPALRADDSAPPPAQPGYRNVPIKEGGHTAYIQVKDSGDPYKNVKDSGSDTPDHFSFGKTSSMANQKYDLGNTASSHDSGSYRDSVERTFLTKSYFDKSADGADKSTPGLHSAVAVNSAEGYLTPAAGYDKSFVTARAEVDQNKAAEGTDLASSYQGQSANLGRHDFQTFASPLGSKTFQGPEADATKRDLTKMNEGLLGMKDLPDRALTIDEVRALINEGVKPAVGGKPSAPSKALNDPDYMPDPAPAPLRVKPGEEHHLTDDNDIIPAPGMVAHPEDAAAPEDSEPLPQPAPTPKP